MQKTDPIKKVTTKAGGWSFSILRQIGELDAVVGEHRVDAVRHRSNQRFQEGDGSSHIGSLDQLDEGELRGAIDGYEKMESALGGAHLGQVDMEGSDVVRFSCIFFDNKDEVGPKERSKRTYPAISTAGSWD